MSSEDILKYFGIALGGGGLATIANIFVARRKSNAEADATLSKATLEFAAAIKADLKDVRDRLFLSEESLDKAKKENNDLKVKLQLTEAKATQLQDIVNAMKERDEKQKALFLKVVEALKQYDPNNPLINTLSNF